MEGRASWARDAGIPPDVRTWSLEGWPRPQNHEESGINSCCERCSDSQQSGRGTLRSLVNKGSSGGTSVQEGGGGEPVGVPRSPLRVCRVAG